MKLYVGNLPWSIDDKALKKLFSSYGKIEDAVLIKDKYSGRSKGFGFITFTNNDDAKKAISEMHEKEVEGRALTVSEAKPMISRDNAPRYNNRKESKSSEAPKADPSAIEEDEESPEILDDDSETDTEEEIDTEEEALEDDELDK